MRRKTLQALSSFPDVTILFLQGKQVQKVVPTFYNEKSQQT